MQGKIKPLPVQDFHASNVDEGLANDEEGEKIGQLIINFQPTQDAVAVRIECYRMFFTYSRQCSSVVLPSTCAFHPTPLIFWLGASVALGEVWLRGWLPGERDLSRSFPAQVSQYEKRGNLRLD